MDYAESTTPTRQLDGSCYWVPPGLFEQIIDAILIQLKRAGFKAVFADGHGPSRWAWVANMADREARLGLKLFGVTNDIAKLWKSQIDHAGRNETSLMLALRPDLVDLGQLSHDPEIWPQGVAGHDPRHASIEHGQECLQASVALVRQKLVAAGLLAE
jgi:creatinine amidohydrolase